MADAATQSANAAAMPAAPSMDIEGAVRQAQSQRLAGHYDDAIHTLSQLMLIASDDPRVVGEYGKTLTEKGRAQDAVQFLTRATELQPNDWSFYSALGVAYDQVGDQSAARMAYEHALKLNPNEPSVLNNYALSRMLANDPDTARQLIARAQTAGGASDPKIARNIELVNKLAPAAQPAPNRKPASAAAAPTPVSAPMRRSPAARCRPRAPMRAECARAAAPGGRRQSRDAGRAGGSAGRAGEIGNPFADAAGDTCQRRAKTDIKDATPARKAAAAVKTDVPKADVKADAKIAAKRCEAGQGRARQACQPPTQKPATKTAAVKPEAKPVKAVTAEAKPDAKSPAKPASKTAIPDLRQTASVY